MANYNNKFFKVSYEEFRAALIEGDGTWRHDLNENIIKELYNNIKLPKQATGGSAGHDFFTPLGFKLLPGESIKIPTGIRASLGSGRFLAIFPRSGLGFKYRLQLDNTVGIVDEDYICAENEGHIFIKITNDSRKDQTIRVYAGDAIAQGIILPYEIAEGAEADSDKVRTGGFGSTTDSFEFGNAKQTDNN